MREKLQILLLENKGNIAEHIINEALQEEDTIAFFKYIFDHGVQS